jgi:Carboxypeptidase regulatory-like domain
MFTQMITCGFFRELLAAVLPLALFASAQAQSTTTLQGRVVDPKGEVVPGVKVLARSQATGVERIAQTDSDGAYRIAALPAGAYRVEVRSTGFQTQVVERLNVEFGRMMVKDFRLSVGDISQEVSVSSGANQIERASISVGQVIDQRTVQEIPVLR